MDCSPPGFSVHGVFQARILEWIAKPSSRGSSRPGDLNQVSCIASGLFSIWAAWEAWWTYRLGANNHFLEDYSEDETTGDNVLCLAHRQEPTQAPSSPSGSPQLNVEDQSINCHWHIFPPTSTPPANHSSTWLSQKHALCGLCWGCVWGLCVCLWGCVCPNICMYGNLCAHTWVCMCMWAQQN